MRITIEIPERLLRQVEAKAGLEGRSVGEVTVQLYAAWVGAHAPAREPTEPAMDAWLARWSELGDRVRAAAIDDRHVSEIIGDERR